MSRLQIIHSQFHSLLFHSLVMEKSNWRPCSKRNVIPLSGDIMENNMPRLVNERYCCQVWGFYDGEDLSRGLLARDAFLRTCYAASIFRVNWWRYGPPKRWFPRTTLHGVNNPEGLKLKLRHYFLFWSYSRFTARPSIFIFCQDKNLSFTALD